MKKTIATVGAALAMSLLTTLAHAAQTNTGCQGNCPTGDTITNAGGAGGTGIGIGNGGTGYGGDGGKGGSVLGSGNSSNTNTQGQQQGQAQLQGQQQGQIATGGNAAQGQSQASRNDNKSQAQGNVTGVTTVTNTGVTVAGDTITYEAPRIPVATAYAAGLTASNGTCMGSTSAGGQGMSFGFSVGTTWKDGSCDRRYNAQALAAVGQAKAAVALLCQDPEIKAAMETAGTPCAVTSVAKAAAQAQQAEVDAVTRGESADPIVRLRLGLPPLAKR